MTISKAFDRNYGQTASDYTQGHINIYGGEVVYLLKISSRSRTKNCFLGKKYLFSMLRNV